MTHDYFLFPDSESDDERHALSPTAHVLDELALHGYRPNRDEPDPRPLPERETVQAHLGEIVDGFAAMLADTRLEGTLMSCCGRSSIYSIARLIGSPGISMPTSRRSGARSLSRTAPRFAPSNSSV